MGIYLNPGNEGFREILASDYIDKTGLIEVINQMIGTRQKLSCISRPRRFGKSYAAQMLCAYYDCSCDSRALFDHLNIARTENYTTHINSYHVISLDLTGFISAARIKDTPLHEIPARISTVLREELVELYPELSGLADLSSCLIKCTEITSRKFVFVIDEWDALIREARNDQKTQNAWLNLLREWFKNNNLTPRVVAAAYMTGILPIKKDGSQSAISDFREYSILYTGRFAPFTGLLEEEVRALCSRYGMSYGEIRSWYDGYTLQNGIAVYNPYSVMNAMEEKSCRSFWKKTSAAESLLTYTNMDFDGMHQIITRLIAGEEIPMDPDGFENDFETFRCRDDVLTLMVHLGYLTFNTEEKTVRIPNEEVRSEFNQILQGNGISPKWIQLIRQSQELIKNTIEGNEEAVVRGIEAVRDMEYAPTFYNDEQALRYVIKFAYIAAVDQYIKIEELPSGHGIADVVYIPGKRSALPALVIELKWNRTAKGSLQQIKDRHYPAVLAEYGGDIILAGINYNPRSKKHSCRIERICTDT